jgi:hemerythrin-like domain-containing protein
MTDPLEMLTNEHRQVEELMGRLDDADGDEQRGLCDQLEQMLTLHMDLEEEHLYPMVQRVVGDEEATEANTEHQLARDGLAKVIELLGAPGFGDALDMLRAGIKHHVEEEENEVFPQLREQVDQRELDELGVTLEQAHGETPTDDDDRELMADRADLGDTDERAEAKRSTRAASADGHEPSKQELYEMAKEAGIKGRSSMNKEQLERALQRQQG